MTDDSYTELAIAALTAAGRDAHDFAGWLAHVLAASAAQLGSSAALTARRPNTWAADLVQQLVKGTVGARDEHLSDYQDHSPGPIAPPTVRPVPGDDIAGLRANAGRAARASRDA